MTNRSHNWPRKLSIAEVLYLIVFLFGFVGMIYHTVAFFAK